MGHAFLGELKRTQTNASPIALEEAVNDVIHQVTKKTMTKYK